MKLAYCALLPDSDVNLFGYRGSSMEKTLEDIKNASYGGVELFLRDPAALDRPLFDRLLERFNLEVCAIGTAAISAQDKLTLCHMDEEKRKAAVERAKRLVDFSADYNRPPVCLGKFRGNLDPNARPLGWKKMRESFLELCDYALGKNVSIALEPQERGNINNLNSTKDGVMWVEQIGAPNLKLILDTYHMCMEDSSLSAGFMEGAKYLCHVHASDRDRKAPGTGGLDFCEALKALRAINYGGYISVEIAQGPDALNLLKKSAEYLNNALNSY